MERALFLSVASGALVACNGTIQVDGGASGLSVGTGGSSGGATSSTTSATSGSSGGTGSTGSTGGSSGGTSGDTGPIFDVGDTEPPPDGIPKTCSEAQVLESTVGCLFYGADLDNHPVTTTDAWGLAVANVQEDPTVKAHVRLQVKVAGSWMDADEGWVAAGELLLFTPLQIGHSPSGLVSGGAVRVWSDVPITAYQFNPIAAGRSTSDGSMLQPAAHWDHQYQVMGTPHIGNDNNGELYAYISVVASRDDTVVEVVPSVQTHGGPDVPMGEPGVPFQVTLDEGDVLQVAAANEGEALTGTTVETSEDTPVAVWTAHRCGRVGGAGYCDHLEEQHLGLHQWGTDFVATRVPVRSTQEVEPAIWQISAAEDGTTVTFDAAPEVTGLPGAPLVLQAGETVELTVAGTAENPGDFTVSATAPVQVMQYAVGGQVVGQLDFGNNMGDPASVQLAPLDQFMERYVLLAPPKWVEDYVVVGRSAGEPVQLDGAPLPDSAFSPIGDGTYEVARVLVEDGTHVLEAATPFSVLAVGWDAADSYAYLGGSRTKFIYDPQG